MGGQLKAVANRLLQTISHHLQLGACGLERSHTRLPAQHKWPLSFGPQLAPAQQLTSGQPLQPSVELVALAIGGIEGHQCRRHPHHSVCPEDAAS